MIIGRIKSYKLDKINKALKTCLKNEEYAQIFSLHGKQINL